MNKILKARPTIGLLSDWSENPYHTAIRDGVIEAAEANDANLICFIGGALKSANDFESRRNILYNIVRQSNLDGLIISSASIGHYISQEQVTEFCHTFKGFPVVSIALPVKSIPSVLVDNRKGLEFLFSHFIEDHGYRQIAFVKGPENNPEALSRYEVYRESLEKHNIPFDKQLIVEGDFTLKNGINAVKILIDRRKVNFDAIVAANDEMAFGILQELHNRGIQVPRQVAVGGFDDIEESRYYTPSLTTVKQPLKKQGRKGAELLLEKIKGNAVADTHYLVTELKTRESCGCLLKKREPYNYCKLETPGTEQKKIFNEYKKELGETISRELLSAREFPCFADFKVEDLLESFYQELIEKKEGAFLYFFNNLLINSDASCLPLYQKLITLFRKKTIPIISDNDTLHQAENLWHEVRVLLAELTYRNETMERLQAIRKNQSMRDLAEFLSTKIDIESLLTVIATQLPKIGVPSCYLSLFQETTNIETSQLLLAFNPDGRIPIQETGFPFPSREIIPKSINLAAKRYTFVAEALFHGETKLGFVLFEMGPKDGRVYELLRLRISNALQGTLLLKQLKGQANTLENEVKKRTADLLEANRQLQQEIAERKHAEEELKRSNTELEQFAYIASHDLQEPLRMIGSFVGLLARRYTDKLDNDANDFIQFAVDGAKRMQDMINDLLTYSRVRTRSREKTPVDINKVVNETLESLNLVISEKKVKILLDPLPEIIAEKPQMRQLFLNIISNALKFNDKPGPVVEIRVKEDETEYTFSIRDNGIGIEPKYETNIFVMFRRLHGRDEYPGTGIGLAICKKITELHGGKIWFESEPGKGSTFYFTLPKRGDFND